MEQSPSDFRGARVGSHHRPRDDNQNDGSIQFIRRNRAQIGNGASSLQTLERYELVGIGIGIEFIAEDFLTAISFVYEFSFVLVSFSIDHNIPAMIGLPSKVPTLRLYRSASSIRRAPS